FARRAEPARGCRTRGCTERWPATTRAAGHRRHTCTVWAGGRRCSRSRGVRMLEQSERDELRSLQLKAYGRAGGLTEAEAERLRELESHGRRAPGATPDHGA